MKNSLPTPYPELNQVLQELISNEIAILKGKLAGAYLQGSFAVGDFDIHSDVDFILAIHEELDGDEVEQLQEMHGRIFKLASPWAQHLEGSYFPVEVLRKASRRREKLWYLDNGSNRLTRSEHCNTLIVRWIVREKGVILAGPPALTLVDPIPLELLRAEIQAVIADWGQEILDNPERYNNRFYQTFIVLSYCRMLHDLLTGVPGSKRSGAEWAKANLDAAWSGLIDRTWSGRPHPEISVRTVADPQDFEATLRFVKYGIEQSRRRLPA